MRTFHKKLATTAAAGALMAVIGAAWAQSTTTNDPEDTPQVAADAANGAHILNFKNQGNAPETDPAAHLILIKDAPAVMPVAQTTETTTTTTSTTVADATPAPAPAPDPAPAADTSTSTDTAAAPADTDSMPAPRADRN